MTEDLNPAVDGHESPHAELQEKANWLRSGHYDTSEAHGNAATAIIVDQEDGKWIVPLKGGLEIVDAVDGDYLIKSVPYVRVVEPSAANSLDVAEVQVAWTGTDDNVRTSFVALDQAQFVPREQ